MQPLRDYDVSVLEEKQVVIPGPEPKINHEAEMVIQVCTPDLGEKETEYVTDAIKSGWISSRGEYLNRFEEEFAKKVGAKYAVAVNSGTSALHLALATLGVGEGDEVIVPSATMVSTAFAVSYLGATPVFVDCTDNLNIIYNPMAYKQSVDMVIYLYAYLSLCWFIHF